MTVAQVLKDARSLIEKRSSWTHGAYAIDRKGNPIDPRHENAVCFCLQGAILRQCDLSTEQGKAIYFQAVTAVRRQLRDAKTVTGFNDSNDHKAVLALLDKAVSA